MTQVGERRRRRAGHKAEAGRQAMHEERNSHAEDVVARGIGPADSKKQISRCWRALKHTIADAVEAVRRADGTHEEASEPNGALGTSRGRRTDGDGRRRVHAGELVDK